MRKTLVQQLREEFPVKIEEAFGYITKHTRDQYGIKKTHISDARCIAGAPLAMPLGGIFLIIPVRRHNRQIHKASILKGGICKKIKLQSMSLAIISLTGSKHLPESMASFSDDAPADPSMFDILTAEKFQQACRARSSL